MKHWFSWICTYLMSWLIALSYLALRLTGRIKIIGGPVPSLGQRPLIVVSNHPSLLEPIILPALFAKEFLFRPWRSPWSTPDIKNFGSRFWFWLRPRCVFITRNDPRKAVAALRQMEQILRDRGTIILFAEGGRTSSVCACEREANGGKLRPLQPGLARLVVATGATVLPIWVEGADRVLPNKPGRLFHTWPRLWRQVTLNIGDLMTFPTVTRERASEVTECVTQTLLTLSECGM